MNKLTALVESAKAASKDDWWKETTLVSALEPYTTHYSYSAYKDAKFIALANPATILELCALLEKAEEALETVGISATDGEYVVDTWKVEEALAEIKQWKDMT